jgi:transposase
MTRDAIDIWSREFPPKTSPTELRLESIKKIHKKNKKFTYINFIDYHVKP